MPYTILPTTSLHYYENPITINVLRDNNIRESSINSAMNNGFSTNIEFSNTLNNSFNPNISNNLSLLTQHNILAENPEMIQEEDFIYIIQNSIQPELQLLLASPIISSNNNIYPFLEYKVN